MLSEHDSIRCLEQSAGLGNTVVPRDVGPFMTQRISPVLRAKLRLLAAYGRTCA
jgi:hypothetical protein